MNRRQALRDVFESLDSEGLLDNGWHATFDAELERNEAAQPWYVRTMVGFGAWLASLLLIVFIAGITSFATESPFIVLGLLFIVTAVVVRRRIHSDFSDQAALAASLAGQGLFVFAVAELSGDFTQAACVTLGLLNAVLLAVYPDTTHRFFSVVLIVVAVTILLYAHELNSWVPILAPLLALSWVATVEHETTLSAAGFGSYLGPVRAGLLISAFGSLLLSTIYVLPDFAGAISFYPRPWISTLLLGAMLLRAVNSIVPDVFPQATSTQRATVLALTTLVLAASWTAPGIALALLVVALAAQHGHAWARGAGIAFLVVFLTAYFYGIEIGMLAKSATLVATGSVLLACRWLLLHSTRGDAHA